LTRLLGQGRGCTAWAYRARAFAELAGVTSRRCGTRSAAVFSRRNATRPATDWPMRVWIDRAIAAIDGAVRDSEATMGIRRMIAGELFLTRL